MQRFFISATFTVLTTLGLSSQALAQAKGLNRENVSGDDSPTIFDVRKSLPMEPTEPSFHDFYINAGVEAGFKKGQYLPVHRSLPIHDPVQNKQQGILTIPVGKILVIHVERNITVARLASELGDDERPTLEYEAVMIGDKIDMKGITTEAPKEPAKKKKRGTASLDSPSASIAIVVPATAPGAAPAFGAAPALATAPQVQTAPLNPDPEKSGTVKSDSKSATQPSVSPQRVTQKVPPPTA